MCERTWWNVFVFRRRVCQRQRDDQPAARHHRGFRRYLRHGGGEPVSHEQQQQPERRRQLQAEGDHRLGEPGGGVWLAGGPGGGLPLLRLLFRALWLEGARVLTERQIVVKLLELRNTKSFLQHVHIHWSKVWRRRSAATANCLEVRLNEVRE